MYNSGIGTPYWFEWEIGILECLNMLQDTSIESVILQSTDFQALDDVVVNYSDKSILNIQVKHTDEDANFTYSFLASGKKPLLNELALEWKNNKDNYNLNLERGLAIKNQGNLIYSYEELPYILEDKKLIINSLLAKPINGFFLSATRHVLSKRSLHHLLPDQSIPPLPSSVFTRTRVCHYR